MIEEYAFGNLKAVALHVVDYLALTASSPFINERLYRFNATKARNDLLQTIHIYRLNTTF